MRRTPLLLLALTCLLHAACSNQVAGCGTDCGCFTSDDCPGENICFLGTCQGTGYTIDTVYIDLMPSTATGFLPQPDPGNPRDLSRGLNLSIPVRSAVTVAGQVSTPGAPLGGLVSAQVHTADANAVVLPSLQALQQAVVGRAMTFSLTLVPGNYDISLQPTLSPNMLLPPLAQNAVPVTADTRINLDYPTDRLVSLSGTLVAQGNTLSPVTGAQVTGTALDANGERLVAASSVTNSSGHYTLQYVPGGSQYSIVTHPGPLNSGNPLVPSMTFGVSPHATTRSLGTQILNIPALGVAVVTLVQAPDGAPVRGASLQFSGNVGTVDQPGTFQATATTDASGEATVTLLAGTYSVSVLPLSGQGLASCNIAEVCVDLTTVACAASVVDGGSLALTLQHQISASGTVTDNGGNAVAAARVEYITAVDTTNRRTFATTTDARGHYQLRIDPGTAQRAAAYELHIEPGQPSAVPRSRELLRVGTNDFEHDVHIYAPAFVYGSVRDPNGVGLSDVTIALYSADLGSAGQPLLIGLGKSMGGGEFVIPIPTAN